MNRLGVTLICTIFILGAYSQVPGTWFRDWQNNPNSLCSPDSFTVSNNSNHFAIAYNFSKLSLKYCPSNASATYTAGLIVNSSTGNWVDSNGQQLVYDSVNDVVQFLFNNNSTSYLYDKNGAALPQEQTLGYLGGTWISPTPLGSASLQNCCVPDSLFVSPVEAVFNGGELYVLPSFSSNCSVKTTQYPTIQVPNLQVANWTGPGFGASASANYIFDLTNTSQLTLTLANGSNVCGSYSYQKAPGVKLLNNTWYLDWQSQSLAAYYPSVYQVSPVNNSYMTTALNYSGTAFTTSLLVQNLQGSYFDNIAGLRFAYGNSTKSLLGVAPGAIPDTVLYSLNGSLVDNPLTESYWNNPQSVDNNPISTDCCAPNWAYIYPAGSKFDIEYYFPDDYLSVPECEAWAALFTENTLTSSLYIGTPSTSASNLTWDDGWGSQVYFADMSNLSVITIGSFLGDGNCSFNLAVTSQKPPSPLSSVWMAVESKVFVLIGIVMLLAGL